MKGDGSEPVETLRAALTRHGLILRGGLHPQPDDEAPDGIATLLLIGNAGAAMWPHFQAGRRDEPDPLDRWCRRVIDPLAARLNGRAFYPGDGPPYRPFQRWALKAEPVHPSPLGLLVHPEHGLWHAYRGAIGFADRLPLPRRDRGDNPCTACRERPCLAACPVEAFSDERYDTGRCAAHLHRPAGRDCLEQGCRARRACPVGRSAYASGQAAFHMDAFLANHAP